MRYWLHRISYHAEVSYPLIDKNILSIGFSDFANHEFINKVLNEDTWEKRWKVFETEVKSEWRSLPRTRYNLWRFVEGFKKGDRIIVPSSGVFSIYELVSDMPHPIKDLSIENLKDWHGNEIKINNDLLCKGEKVIDIGFFWNVKPIALKISRKKYADSALTRRMKFRMTNANITDLSESIKKALISFEEKRPINIHSTIIDSTCDIVLNSIEQELNPDKFEKLIYLYFQEIGATNVYIPAKNENGKEGDADIVSVFEKQKLIIYTQAKFQKKIISDWGVRQVLDYKMDKESIDDGYNKIAWVVTTAKSFSEEAKKEASENGIQLINGLGFSKMLLDAGISMLDKGL